jgi:hypothetical protein
MGNEDGATAGLPIRSSPAIEQLLAALAQAQGTFGAIEKDKRANIATRSGAHYSYTYADLANVLGAVRAPLSTNALSLLQPVRVQGHAVIVTTVLAHASGQWCSSELELPIADPADARSLASAITYGRRYSLISLLALAPAEGEDDDASAAAKADPLDIKARDEWILEHALDAQIPPPAPIPSPPSPDPPPPPPPAAGPWVHVLEVREAPTRNPKVTMYRVTLSSGEEVTTIKTGLASRAKRAREAGTPVRATIEKSKFGMELVALVTNEPPTADEIPF